MSNSYALASKLKDKLPKKVETLIDSHPVIRYIKAHQIEKNTTL
jgi:hypothetical protein